MAMAENPRHLGGTDMTRHRAAQKHGRPERPFNKKGADVQLDEQLIIFHSKRKQAIDELVNSRGFQAVARSYSRTSMEELFDDWAQKDYDGHMAQHDETVRRLLRLLTAIHSARMDLSVPNMFGGRTLEMSCGTGTVIESIVTELAKVDPDAVGRLVITANDLSKGMQAIAKQKLAQYDLNIRYTRQDLRQMRLEKALHMAILSQTLHLITDPKILLREREYGNVPEDDLHRAVKTRVIQDVFRKLEDNGYFVLIDEWPPKLSRKTKSGTLDPMIEMQFDENFRPVATKSDFRERIMGRVPCARFVAEFKLRIDAYHSMSLFVYEKDPTKTNGAKKILPATEAEAIGKIKLQRAQIARQAALDRIISTYRMVDEVFVDCYIPVNGEAEMWKSVRAINGGETFDTRTDGTTIDTSRRYDTIIIAGVLHNMEPSDREKFIQSAIDSLKTGGAIMFVDEWDPPSTSQHPIQKRQLRNELIEQHQHTLIFEGALRQSILRGYGSAYYLYGFRKKN